MLSVHQGKILEDAKQAEDGTVQITVNELLYYIEQIVLLLGQSSNVSQKIERRRVHNEFTIIPRENNVKTKSSTVTET